MTVAEPLSQRTLLRGLLVGGLILTALLVRPFVEAILWGLVFSAASRPLFQQLSRRLPGRFARDFAGVAGVFAALVCLAGPVALVGLIVWSQLANQADAARFGSMSDAVSLLDRQLHPMALRFGLDISLTQLWSQYSGTVIRQVGGLAVQAAQSGAQDIGSMAVGLICQFFFLRDEERWRNFGSRVLGADMFTPLASLVYRSMRAILKGIVVVAVIQGVVMGLAYAVAGVSQWVLLMVGTVILSMIPLVGPPVLFIPVSVGFMLHGDWGRGLGLLAFGAGVVSQIDNVLRPILIGNDTGLHPLAVFFGLLGGVVLLGPVGLFAGPVIISATLHLLQARLEQADVAPVA